MKILSASLFAAFVLASPVAFGATVATYTPLGDPNTTNDAVDQNSNLDNLWSYYSVGNSSTAGSYLSTTAFSSPTWATYSISHSANIYTNASVFGGALTVGQTLSLSLADQTVGSSVAINLTDGGTNLNGGTGTVVFSLTAATGAGQNWKYTDGSSSAVSTGISTTATDNTLFNFTFDMTSATTYSATFGTFSWSGTIASPVDTVNIVNYENQSNGTNDNVYVGALSVSAAPEPSSMALFAMGGGLMSLLALAKWRKISSL